jgi:phage terminase Nu1 subunit (DNA packaging protein)
MRAKPVFRLKTSELAEITGVTHQTVLEWALSWLKPAVSSRGWFAGRLAIQLWAHNVLAPPAPEGEETKAEAERRKAIAVANREELRVQAERGELVERGSAIKWACDLAAESRAALQAIPRRMATHLQGRPPREIEAELSDAIRTAIGKLARDAGTAPRAQRRKQGRPRKAAR